VKECKRGHVFVNHYELTSEYVAKNGKEKILTAYYQAVSILFGAPDRTHFTVQRMVLLSLRVLDSIS